MLKWGILIVSTGDREESMLITLASISKYYPMAPVTAVLQGYNLESPVYKHPQIERILSYSEGIGPHSARVAALSIMLDDEYDAVINFDDDMELIPETDLRPSIVRSQSKGVGLVSNNWRRSHSMIEKVKRQHTFKPQAIVPTGGGLTYSRRTGHIILEGPDLDYLFDDVEWSLRSYLAGLQNQRYLGSLSVHAIMGAGGRNGWVNKRERALSDSRFVEHQPMIKATTTTGPKNGYKIPLSGDLTRETHEIHRKNRIKILGGL